MSPEPTIGDAFGSALLAHQEHGYEGVHVIERDDGWVDTMAAAIYFGDVEAWAPLERNAIEWVGNRALDVGAGAGRVSLLLQDMGTDVTALDVSPGAIEVCRQRDVAQTFLGTTSDLAATRPEPFDTFLLFGNNLGLLGSREEAAEMLGSLRAMARPGARVIGTFIDPYDTDNPNHLAYHDRNRERGRMSGQVTLRVRYQGLSTPWFDLLWLSLDELRELIELHGWALTRHWEHGPLRAVVLELRSASPGHAG